MRRIIYTIILLFCAASAYSQNTITLVVSGEGATKQEATANALRSAIEQTFGTFVSANTIVLNDAVVNDEIATISSGNIESYEEVSSYENQNRWSLTLKATVSINKLISYVQGKGAETEFAGQTFAMQMKMRRLNKENEEIALNNLIDQVREITSNISLYDYSLTQDEPKYVKGGIYSVPIKVTATPNANYSHLLRLIKETYKALSLSADERLNYAINNFPYEETIPITGYNMRDKYWLRSSKKFLGSTSRTLSVYIEYNRISFTVERMGSGSLCKFYYAQNRTEDNTFPINLEITESVLSKTTGFKVYPSLYGLKMTKPEMVDLGLSVKWASCNLGVTNEYPSGRYFAFGDIIGQLWNGSDWSMGGFSSLSSYKLDANKNLELEFDAANFLLRGNWRMPTKAEWEELINNCTSIWTNDYEGTGIPGRIFTSTKSGYTDKSIFLPANGSGGARSISDLGSSGYYRSSTNNYNSVWTILFNSGNVRININNYHLGFSIRPVSE